MNGVRNLLADNFPQFVLIFCALGFLGLLAEFLILKLSDWQHIVAISLSAACLSIAILGIFAKPALANMLALILLVMVAFGAYGLFGHVTAAPKHCLTATEIEVGTSPQDNPAKRPAPLVPLAFSGLAALSAAAMVARREE